jgi:hypothetical protein
MTCRVVGWPGPARYLCSCFTGGPGTKQARGPVLGPSMQPVGQHGTVERCAGPGPA